MQVIPDIDIIYDYETIGDRQCRIIMQVAAHVSGAAYYYQRKHITNDPWDEKKASQLSYQNLYDWYKNFFFLFPMT